MVTSDTPYSPFGYTQIVHILDPVSIPLHTESYTCIIIEQEKVMKECI